VQMIREYAEKQKSRAEAENAQLRTELASARRHASQNEQDLLMERHSCASIRLERDNLLEASAANSSRLKQK